jgi:hypothetical protein
LCQVDSHNVWQSLVAFNIGIEVGQLMLIPAAWPMYRLMQELNENAWCEQHWNIDFFEIYKFVHLGVAKRIC